ncbi:MAG: hypothetical protein ABWY54_03500 [Glaciihabitans sp.]
MRGVLRVGLLLLAAVELTLGVWTTFFPRSFYDDVPTVDLTPPFSEHLMRDFGGATLGIAVVLAAAGIWLERRLAVVALVAYLAFSVPHLVFHVGHLDGATGVEAVVLVGLLAASVALPLLLLVLALRAPIRRGARVARAPQREEVRG